MCRNMLNFYGVIDLLKKQSYNTKARRYILEYLSSASEKTVSAGDIMTYLENKGENINLTTVYRYLNKLSDEKKVIKFIEEVISKILWT